MVSRKDTHNRERGTTFAVGPLPEVEGMRAVMWNLFNCYLSGRHDFGMWCEPGAIFLRCVHCGKRSPGWTVTNKLASTTAVRSAAAVATPVTPKVTRVLPFGRVATG